LLFWIKKCILTSFITSKMRSDRKAQNRGNQQSWQCSSTPVSYCQGFLSKEQCENIGAPPYSPDRVSGDFYPFPWLKSPLKQQHFHDATDIVKKVTEELKRSS
jgi:hypothetical protein